MPEVQNDLAAPTTPTELPRGLAINAVQLTCPGKHVVTKFPASKGGNVREVRRALEQRIGQSVHIHDGFAYASGRVESEDGNCVEVHCDLDPALHLFDLRSSLAAHAESLGLSVYFSFGGVMNLSGFDRDILNSRFRIESRLELRVTSEGDATTRTFIVARSRRRMLLADSVAEVADPGALIGEYGVRLSGDGPHRARIAAVSADDSTVTFELRNGPLSCRMQDYAAVASPGLVTHLYGAGAFGDLQVLAGVLTTARKRNQYAVKDRFSGAGEMLAVLGQRLPTPGGDATIGAMWAEVRTVGGGA